MSLLRISAIFRKDLKDAIRDARVLVALLVPLGIGVFYNLTFSDDTTRPTGTVIIATADRTQLTSAIEQVVHGAIDLTWSTEPAQSVRPALAADQADLGLIVPAGFDAAVRAGENPELVLVRPASPTFATDYITAAIQPAIELLAGRAPAAGIQIVSTAKPDASVTILDKIGIRSWSVLASIVMMIAMISMLAVPVILAEETEKKTLDALVLVASHVEVIIAKALVGFTYCAIMVPLLLLITGLRPSWLLFVIAVVLLAVALIGAGLLMGSLFRNANQLNTWSGIILLPVVAPAFIVGLPTPKLLQDIAGWTPAGAATKLLINSAVSPDPFPRPAVAIGLLVLWAVVAYALLLWRLSRKRA